MISNLILTDSGELYPVGFGSHETTLVAIIAVNMFNSDYNKARKYLKEVYEKHRDDVLEIGFPEPRTGVLDAIAIELGFISVVTGIAGISVPIIIMRKPATLEQVSTVALNWASGEFDEDVYKQLHWRIEHFEEDL